MRCTTSFWVERPAALTPTSAASSTLPVADQDLAWAQEDVPDKLQSSDLPSGAYLLVTAGDAPLGRDFNLRRALALALDRTALTKSVSPPGLRPTDAPYPLAAA
jgi:ABC-type oligopeptide transport system substrate-binding subunit